MEWIDSRRNFFMGIIILILSLLFMFGENLFGWSQFSDTFGWIWFVLVIGALTGLIIITTSLKKLRGPVFVIGLIWLMYFIGNTIYQDSIDTLGVGGSGLAWITNNSLWFAIVVTLAFVLFILFKKRSQSKTEIPESRQEKNLEKAKGQVRKSLEISQAKEAGWVALCNEELELLYKLYGALESEERILDSLKNELAETSKENFSVESHNLARFRRIFEKIKEFRLSMTAMETLKNRMKKSRLFKGAL